MSDTQRSPARIDLDPEALGRGLSQIVLVVLELLRELLERQAVRRMDAGELTEDEVERLGQALQSLRRTFAQLQADLADPHDPSRDDLAAVLAGLARADRTPRDSSSTSPTGHTQTTEGDFG